MNNKYSWNETLKFSWGHIIAFLAIIFISYVCYMGNFYQKSADFKAAGKSASPVNMRLSGDMLGSIDLAIDGDKLLIGIPSEESPKAHGHMTGQEGSGNLPKRQFFGVTKKEFDEILKKVAPIAQRTRQRSRSANEFEEILGAINTLGDLFRLGG